MGFANTFKALSNPVRREILVLLKDGELPAGKIAAHFNVTGSTISHHLNVLKKAELVSETRRRTSIIYQLNTSVLEEVMLWLADLKGAGEYEAQGETA